MSCYNPKLAVQYCEGEKVKFLGRVDLSFKEAYFKYGDNLKLIPCGKCEACKIQHANEWATRCYLESLYWPESCFLTLTYDNQHLRKLNKDDVPEFIRKLRKCGIKCAYFGCGEHGEITYRPHYHLCLFGYMPPDLIQHEITENGDVLYTSCSMNSLWGHGFVIVGQLTIKSACYTARYSLKKSGDLNNILFCSLKPAIGNRWYDDNKNRLLDSIIKGKKILLPNGRFLVIPRYFLKLLQIDFPECSQLINQVRSNALMRQIVKNMRDRSDDSLFKTQDELNRKLSIKRKTLKERRKV